jgi:hypothetical protein
MDMTSSLKASVRSVADKRCSPTVDRPGIRGTLRRVGFACCLTADTRNLLVHAAAGASWL